MSNTLNLGTDGNWATKDESVLAYNNENNNFKPLPFDFSRDSIATVVNKDGLIETVGTKEPRIDFQDNAKGSLLLEPTSTNLITQSEAFDNAYWTKSNATVTSGFASPSGDLSAFKLLNNAVTSTHYLRKEGFSVSSGVDYTFSMFAKKGENSFITMMLQGAGWLGSSKQVSFNLLNGTFDYADSGLRYKSTLLNNGFYKIEVTNETASTSVNLRVYSSSTVNDVSSYLGDGTSGIYIYGAQLEQGSYSTSLINTQGTVQTRLVDSCNNGANEQVINSTEGVLYANFYAEADNTEKWISLSDGTSTNRIIVYIPSANTLRIYVQNSSGGQVDFATSITLGQYNKVAFKYKENDFVLFLNGTNVGTDTSGGLPIGLDRLNFADRNGTTNPFIGSVKDVKLYNTALTDAELIALTQV